MSGPIFADYVQDTAAAPGTGTITLNNTPPTGSQAVSVIGTGNWGYFKARNADLTQEEVFKGTFTSPNQLSRDVVYTSSNSNSTVNFTGAITVELVAPSYFFTWLSNAANLFVADALGAL